MQHALAAHSRLQVDAKRIAATSGAIAVHAAVLMMLMMPAKVAPPQAMEVIVEPVWQDRKPLPPPPPPPKPEQPRPQPVTQALQPQVPVVDPPPVNVDQAPSVVDYVAPELPDAPATSFDTGAATSMFQQLLTDAAPPPPYPKPAVMRGIEGTVTLRIHVDASGRPIEVSVESSSGSALLDQAALKFVKARWHFVPAQRDGQAAEGWALVPIEFVLD
jgi:protein TonB